MFYRKLMLSTILMAYPMLARGATDVDKLFDNLDKDSNLDDHRLKLNHRRGNFVENMVVFAGGADFNYSQVMSDPENVIKLSDSQCPGELSICALSSPDSPYGTCCCDGTAGSGCIQDNPCVNSKFIGGYDSSRDKFHPRRPSIEGKYLVPEASTE